MLPSLPPSEEFLSLTHSQRSIYGALRYPSGEFGIRTFLSWVWTQSAGIFWPSQFSLGLGLQWPEHT